MRTNDWQVFDHRGRRKYTTWEERTRFLASLPRTPRERYVFCVLLAYSGARISEALALGPDHVEPGRVRFRSLKRRRLHFRTVPVPYYVTDLLLTLQADEATGRYWPVHRSTGYRWISHAMKLAVIDGPHASAKGLRHGFGIRCAMVSVPQHLTQRWLGHARPETTSIYMDAVDAEERAFAERMF